MITPQSTTTTSGPRWLDLYFDIIWRHENTGRHICDTFAKGARGGGLQWSPLVWLILWYHFTLAHWQRGQRGQRGCCGPWVEPVVGRFGLLPSPPPDTLSLLRPALISGDQKLGLSGKNQNTAKLISVWMDWLGNKWHHFTFLLFSLSRHPFS